VNKASCTQFGIIWEVNNQLQVQTVFDHSIKKPPILFVQ